MADNEQKGMYCGEFTCNNLAQTLARYGFIECNTLMFFLKFICNDSPGPSEFLYIWRKLEECLDHHDDGSVWFADLRKMKILACRAITYNT